MFTKSLLIIGLVAVPILGATRSSAAAANRSAFQEESAVLSFTAVSGLVCDDGSSSTLTSDVFVLASTRKERGTGPSTTEAHAEIVLRNGCTGVFQDASLTVPDADVELSGVNGSTVNASFDLIDVSTEEPLGVLDVALVFLGTGGVTRRLENATRCSDGLTTRTLTQLETRIANIEGTVSLEGDDLLTGVEYFAQLEERGTNEVTVQRSRCACSADDSSDLSAANVHVAASATAFRTEFDTTAANSAFRNVEAIVCADGTAGTLETALSSSASLFDDESSPSNSEASAFMTRSDSCTGETLVGFASAVDPDYDQQGTNSATLNVTFELADPGTGEALGTLETALVFTGTGGPTCDSSFSIMDSPPGVFGEGRVISINRSERVSRAASVSGSVSIGDLELVSDFEFADLVATRQRNVSIEL